MYGVLFVDYDDVIGVFVEGEVEIGGVIVYGFGGEFGCC